MSNENNDKVVAFKKLVENYNVKDRKWMDAKLAQEKAYQARSEVVKEIALLVRPAKRVKINGQVVSIICRTSKKDGSESWFFRGLAENDDVFDVGDE